MDTAQHPPMNGDDDLAKTLGAGLQFEETPVNKSAENSTNVPVLDGLPDPVSLGLVNNTPVENLVKDTPAPENKPDDTPTIQHTHEKASHNDEPRDSPMPPKASGDLEKIKTSALEELRPLVGKLNLPSEEKFDTLLLIIRTTDDQSLLEEAHAAAKTIEDDTRRAQALLDIIKEIDYFSTKRS